jgi:hypothetical protein
MKRLVLLLAFTSCGFADEQDFKGSRIGQGDAPWTDRGTLAVCMTPTLMGAPDSDPSGLCLPQNQQSVAGCRSDGDCRSRERCICGLCSVQFCDGPGQCGTSKECNFSAVGGYPVNACGIPCSSLEPCPGDDDVCDHGFCSNKCMADRDCQTGEFCSTSHRCVARGCKVDNDCVAGVQRCAIQRNPSDLREPALLDSPLVMYVELRPTNSTGEIWRATTTDDGQTWRMDPPQAVLTPDVGERRVSAPSVVRRGGQILMFFEKEAGGIGLALSDDGKAFTRMPAQVHATGLSPGAAVLDDGTLLIYYDAGGAIGLVTSADAQTFDDHGPVLTAAQVTDPLLWRFIDRIGQPAAHARNDAGREIVQLWFTGHGVEVSSSTQSGMPAPPVPNDSIGYAVSTDRGLSFTIYPFNPVFDRVENFVDHDQEFTPAVAPAGDGYLMIYGAADSKNISSNLGSAQNP